MIRSAIVRAIFIAICLSVSSISAGCADQRDKKKCLQDAIALGLKDPVSKVIASRLLDSISSWRKIGLAPLPGGQHGEFLIDAILLDSNKMRGFVVLLRDVADSTIIEGYVEIVACEFKESTWRFYVAGLPSIVVAKSDDKGVAYVRLSEYWRDLLLQDRRLRFDSCRIDSKYFDKFLMPNREYMHRRFLNRR